MKRTEFALLSALWPALAERRAAALFATPLRPRAAAAAPEVPGYWAERREVRVGRHRLATWEWGEDEGPTALLVHGWSGWAGQMSPFVAPLVERGFRVVAFDQPGHGQSTAGRVTVLDLAEAVHALGTRTGQVTALIAHSLGATASVLALRGGLAPQRMVLLAPPAEPVTFARHLAGRLGLSDARFEGMLEHVRRAAGGDLDALHLHRLAPRLRTPVLVLHDVADREVPFSHGEGLAMAWPGARLVVLQKLGHRRLLADARVVSEAVDFVTVPEAASRSAA